jgi:hypothetical protein
MDFNSNQLVPYNEILEFCNKGGNLDTFNRMIPNEYYFSSTPIKYLLSVALISNQLDIVDFLVYTHSSVLNLPILNLACTHYNIETILYLLNKYLNIDVNIKCQDGYSSIMCTENPVIYKELICRGADIYSKYPNGKTFFECLSKEQQVEILEYIENTNFSLHKEDTKMYFANYSEEVRWVRKEYTDICLNGDFNRFKAMVSTYGLDLVNIDDLTDYSFYSNQFEILDFLINMKSSSSVSNTPALFTACLRSNLNIFFYLLKKYPDIDVNMKDSEGVMAILCSSNMVIIKELLYRGADLYSKYPNSNKTFFDQLHEDDKDELLEYMDEIEFSNIKPAKK